MLPGAGRRGEWKVTASGRGVSSGGDENILKLDSGGGHIHDEYTENYCIVKYYCTFRGEFYGV